MEKVLIREAKITESELVADIYQDEGSLKEAKGFRKTAKKEFKEIKEGKRTAFFAEFDNKPVGTVQLVFNCNHKDHANGKTIAEIHHLKVHKNYLRQGIGSALVNAVERLAKARGFRKLTTGVDENNLLGQIFWGNLSYKLLKVEPGRTKKLKLFTLYKNL